MLGFGWSGHADSTRSPRSCESREEKGFHSAAVYGGQSLGKPDVWWTTCLVVVFVQEIAA
jgi:hypothetical protein